MSRAKIKYKKKSFESDGNSSDISANIYMSMLQNKNFKQLSDKQVRLYLYCKAQYYTEKRKPRTNIELGGETSEEFFTMNENKWKNLYGLYTENTRRYFYKDMSRLIELGFIDKVESGQHTRTSNIYKFSDRWWKEIKSP